MHSTRKVVRSVCSLKMNGCNLYQRLNVNHRSNRRGPILLYSTVLYSLSPSPQIAKDGTPSGPGPEPPPMGIGTRPVVHKCGKTARCSRAWHAQPRIRPRGASGRPRARERESVVLCLISCRERSHPTYQDDGPEETREKERKGKQKKKWEPLIITCYHATQIKKKGLFRKLDLSRM